MISFSQLGNYGRLGNQLFQYAFLRTTAERLGVKFYCPPWLGDEIFHLNDQDCRLEKPPENYQIYYEPYHNCGFNRSCLKIPDKRDILGFFQSDRYWDHGQVRSWYAFRDEVAAAVKEKYKAINFSKCVGMNLRFGDMQNNLKYVNLGRDYYRRALSQVRPSEQALIFSDDLEQAKNFLNGLIDNPVWMTGNKVQEDLYLMSQCRDFICSISTFSWWGAWLNRHPDKVVVAPKEWIRPGHRQQNNGMRCAGWVELKNCHPIFDDYRFLVWKERFWKARKRVSEKIY